MGSVLTCTCNNKDPDKLEYTIKGEYDNCGHDSSRITLKKEEDFSFGKSKAKNFQGSKREEHLEAFRLLNLIKKIQRAYRFHKKLTLFSKKNTKDFTNVNQDSPLVICQNTLEKTIFNQNAGNISYFLGNKVNDKKEGFGVQVWKDGAQFKGIFENNQANGLGQFLHSDGDYYSGQFKNDRAYGFGIYLHSNGARYIGEWHDDLQDVIGIEVWQDGSYYKGDYLKGKKHGIGSYYWHDGSKYEGEWEENFLQGFGIYYFTDEKTYTGQWKRNMMHGYGEFNWKDGKKYVGYYNNDKKDGFGIYYWEAPNKAYIGFWSNGRQEGVGKYITPTKTRFGLWKDGEKKQWFTSSKEALAYLEKDQMMYYQLFKYDLKEINSFLNS